MMNENFTHIIRSMKLMLFMTFIFCSTILFAQKKSNNVSMVMPFCSKKIIENPNCYDSQLGNICREYYQGALIALDSFERANIPVHLSIFDTENDTFAMLKILEKPLFKESELVIGPVLQGGNKMLSNLAKQKEVYHISPLMTFSKTKLDDPYWISANPDLPNYAEFIYRSILKQSHDTANIIIINDNSTFDKNINGAFKQIVPANKTVKIKYVQYEKGIDIIKHLSLNVSNHIIISSSNESTITNVLKSIKDTDDTFKMSTYGFPHWLEFKNPDFDIWERMNVSIATSYFVNYDDEKVRKFIAAYREKFYTEPTDAAFKGYDQTLLFVSSLASNGKQFISSIENKTISGLSTKYHFVKESDGGYYQNEYLNMIKIEDSKMKKVN